MKWSERTNTIGLEGVSHLLALIYMTEAVDKPLGALIVGPPGTGKSMILTKLKYEKAIIVNDITGRGLEDLLRDMGRQISGFVVIPDLLKVIARRQSADSFFFLMNILLEEGLTKIQRYDIKIEFPEPLRFGMITAITTEQFRHRRRSFEGSGFLSRNLLISYSYSRQVQEKIQRRMIRGEMPREYLIVAPESRIPDMTPEVEEAIERLAKLLASARGDGFVFRATNQIKSLIIAQGLLDRVEKLTVEQAFEVACVIPFLLGDRYRAEGLGAANDEDYFTMRHLYLREPLPKEFQHIDIERQAERLKKVGVLVETLNGGYKIGGGT